MPYINPEAAVAKETTEGQAPSTVDQQPGGVAQDVSPGESFEETPVRGQAAGRNPTTHVRTNKSAEPSMPTMAQTGEMLEFFFGQLNEDTTGASSAPYTHEIVEAGDIPSFTFNQLQKNPGGSGADMVRQFRGCKVEEFTWTSEDQGLCELELSLMVKEFDGPDNAGTADSTSPLSVQPFAHSDLSTTTFAGREIPHVSSIEVTGTNSLSEIPENGSIENAGQSPDGNREYEVTIETTPDTVDNLSDAYNETEGELVIEYQRGTNDAIKFVLSGCKIEEPGQDAPATDRAEDSLSFVVESAKVEVTDDKATYGITAP